MHGLGLEKELSYILSFELAAVVEPPSSRHSRPVLDHLATFTHPNLSQPCCHEVVTVLFQACHFYMGGPLQTKKEVVNLDHVLDRVGCGLESFDRTSKHAVQNRGAIIDLRQLPDIEPGGTVSM